MDLILNKLFHNESLNLVSKELSLRVLTSIKYKYDFSL